jgi:hypothetical protein
MQLYSQYIDAESGVIKRPEGQGWDDPFGDGVWRTSWFYSSLLILKGKDAALFASLIATHQLTEASIDRFVEYFLTHCTGSEGWSLPKNPSQLFSGDQLAPLLYLFASINQYGSNTAKSAVSEILAKLVQLDQEHGAVSDSHQGQIRDNQRYVIDVVCRMFQKRIVAIEAANFCELFCGDANFFRLCTGHSLGSEGGNRNIALLRCPLHTLLDCADVIATGRLGEFGM